MHDRYGDFILLRPPFKPSTWLLWLAPPVILVLGGGTIAWIAVRRRPATTEPPTLSEVELAALKVLK
jgi:cytochrome c-type biogenesis protein CcmH